jgi:hypothetical protein
MFVFNIIRMLSASSLNALYCIMSDVMICNVIMIFCWINLALVVDNSRVIREF